MKKVFILAIAALSFTACRNANNSTTETAPSSGSTKVSADAPVIVFEREIFDFGKIVQGDKVNHEFKFKNAGKSPLIISNATATCGCTVPEVPKDPILPGKEGSLKVVFNSTGKQGMQDKVITINSNANPSISTVHLVGDVREKK
ncbi:MULTISPECIES: DUF1573 domain-containing protein [unclassified Pedobacter]|uniref:DUF1573 domain-containing protein n=1 Tax=unclassified Pedobacter TaxID=2628915 RepID=UPI000B4AE298|nr:MULTISPECIES: DUF1573 domain-containing protein [unclassified Pedobacter]MCX2429291.1 DUF1573 domain-containing protein [Pedobacter sp. GR22-10]OWK71060.1 hypothetical protein CBW18_08240 [Pedobacter sp. AJM]